MSRAATAVLLAALAAALPATTAPAATHPFYEKLLREGTAAYELGQPAEAAFKLRLAAFGFLDEPQLLASTLVRLALAHASLDDAGAFRDTFARLVEVEQRFGTYQAAELPPALRAAFEERAAAWVPEALRSGLPLAVSSVSPPPPPPAVAAVEVTKADRRAAKRRRREARQQAAERRDGAAIEPATTVPEPHETGAPEAAAEAEPGPLAAVEEPPSVPPAEPPVAPAEPTEEERAALGRAREILQRARRAGELTAAFDLARGIAEAYPHDAEAQELAGEIAYRASRWPEATRYFSRLDLDQAGPSLLFYMAVSFYETGREDRAREALERALPGLLRTPFVHSYIEKILGTVQQ